MDKDRTDHMRGKAYEFAWFITVFMFGIAWGLALGK